MVKGGEGMAEAGAFYPLTVIPAKAGIQLLLLSSAIEAASTKGKAGFPLSRE
jgi:hypothetical protein